MLTRHRTRLYDVNEIGAEENNNYDVFFVSRRVCRLLHQQNVLSIVLRKTYHRAFRCQNFLYHIVHLNHVISFDFLHIACTPNHLHTYLSHWSHGVLFVARVSDLDAPTRQKQHKYNSITDTLQCRRTDLVIVISWPSRMVPSPILGSFLSSVSVRVFVCFISKWRAAHVRTSHKPDNDVSPDKCLTSRVGFAQLEVQGYRSNSNIYYIHAREIMHMPLSGLWTRDQDLHSVIEVWTK